MAHATVAKRITTNMDMCSGPLFKKIIIFAIPIFFTSALQLLFNTADLMVVGRFCGSLSVAAVGSTSSLVHLLVNFFMGLSSGIGVVVATAIGEKDDETVSKTVHTAIPLSLVCGVIVNIALFFGAEWFLQIMDSPDDIRELSATYIKIYACGTIPGMLYNFCAAILRAVGDTVRPLIFLTLSGVINVILNLIFVIVFNMDVAGVALATSISQGISAILVVMELMKRKDVCRLNLSKLRFHFKQLKRIIAIGVPASIQSTTFSFSNVIIQSSINSFGSVAVSGSAAAASLDAFVFCGSEAIHQAAMNFAGQNYGAKKLDRVRRVLRICIASVICIELFLGGILYTLAKPLLSFYISDSSAAVSFGIRRMAFTCLMYFLAGTMQAVLNTLRGMGHSFFPMLISIFSNCVFRIFWILVVFSHFREFSFSWEIIFASYPISWSLAIILGFIVYIYVMKKENRLLNDIKSEEAPPPEL